MLHCCVSLCTCSLYKKIDVERVLCWNEAEDGMGKTVFKPWEDRMNRDKVHVYMCVWSSV